MFHNHSHTAGISLLFLTAALFIALFFTGCEDSGIVGSQIGDPDGEVQSMVIGVSGFEILSENSYAGKLSYSSAGLVNDPVYGEVAASTLIKPALSAVGLDSIYDNYTVRLRIVMDSERYGLEEPGFSDFSVYEAGELWRGNQLFVNDPVPPNLAREIGSFSIMKEDTAIVPLDPAWVTEFAAFFNDTSDTRADRYRNEFPGLMVVPMNVTDQLRFLRYEAAADDSLNLGSTRFEIVGPDSVGQDSVFATVSPLDWGTSMTRTPPAQQPENGVPLISTFESVIKTSLAIDPGMFDGKEIVNAQLTLHLKTDEDALVRPGVTTIRVHRIETLSTALGEYLFTETPQYAASLQLDEDDDTVAYFNINLTGLVLDELYGETETPDLYFSIQSNNGKIYSATLFDETAPEEKRPSLTVTYIETK